MYTSPVAEQGKAGIETPPIKRVVEITMPQYENDFRTVQHFNDPFVAHELTFSCFRHKPFLRSERTREYVASALSLARKQHPFHLWAYVIMPEHVHLLVWPHEETAVVDAFLKTIKQSVSRRALSHLSKENPSGLAQLATGLARPAYRFWQDGPGYDRNVRGDAALRNMINYIHNNPVRRGLVQHIDEWKWSSASEWSGQRKGPIRIDKQSFPTLRE